MQVKIAPMRREDIHENVSSILTVYGEAFSEPPYNRDEVDAVSFRESLKRHMDRPGFRFIAAWSSQPIQMVGFAYGYRGASGQWWHDKVKAALQSGLNKTQVDFWLSDNFEFVELALRPSWHGIGIGGRLHDLLLKDIPQRTALLSTIQTETPALFLYRKRGWKTLVEEFYYAAIQQPYQIMGLDMKHRRKGKSSPI